MNRIELQPWGCLLLVDVQNDFVTGSLAVPGAEGILPVLNRYIALFTRCSTFPIVATRDWHPEHQCSSSCAS
jgi:nicotinamidase-related amidase